MENLCTFIGNLGANPDVKTLNDESKVAQFNIACSEKGYTKKDGTQVPERTEWITIVTWRRLAEIIEKYAKKGSRIYVRGKFKTKTYDDEQGIKRWKSFIEAEYIELLDGKRESSALPTSALMEEPAPAPANNAHALGKDDDDLPF